MDRALKLTLIFLWGGGGGWGRGVVFIRDFTQNTTATATTTSPNKRFNEQNNSCARAL